MRGLAALMWFSAVLVLVEEAAMMKLSEIMTRNVVTVTPETSSITIPWTR